MAQTVRVGAIQTQRRAISYKASTVEDALKEVRANLDELIALAERAAGMGCDIVAFPEDTLGTLEWEAGHWDEVTDFLRAAEQEMLTYFGEVATRHGMYIICCNDCVEKDRVYNTAVLLGRDGREMGRYHKVQLPLTEQARARGTHFPVFEAPDIGTIGMCICYDMMFPETTRALALAGAEIVFHLTMGGASLVSSDASLAAFKTRAAENYLYVVVAFRNGGSLIINPKGEIPCRRRSRTRRHRLGRYRPLGGPGSRGRPRGITSDFRARLFRERVPSAYGILLDEHPPILEKLKHISVLSTEQAAALCAEGLTIGADAFYEAEHWLAEGKVGQAKRRFEELAEHFGPSGLEELHGIGLKPSRSSRAHVETLDRALNRTIRGRLKRGWSRVLRSFRCSAMLECQGTRALCEDAF